jgi:hypothetical protein
MRLCLPACSECWGGSFAGFGGCKGEGISPSLVVKDLLMHAILPDPSSRYDTLLDAYFGNLLWVSKLELLPQDHAVRGHARNPGPREDVYRTLLADSVLLLRVREYMQRRG